MQRGIGPRVNRQVRLTSGGLVPCTIGARLTGVGFAQIVLRRQIIYWSAFCF